MWRNLHNGDVEQVTRLLCMRLFYLHKALEYMRLPLAAAITFDATLEIVR